MYGSEPYNDTSVVSPSNQCMSWASIKALLWKFLSINDLLTWGKKLCLPVFIHAKNMFLLRPNLHSCMLVWTNQIDVCVHITCESWARRFRFLDLQIIETKFVDIADIVETLYSLREGEILSNIFILLHNHNISLKLHVKFFLNKFPNFSLSLEFAMFQVRTFVFLAKNNSMNINITQILVFRNWYAVCLAHKNHFFVSHEETPSVQAQVLSITHVAGFFAHEHWTSCFFIKQFAFKVLYELSGRKCQSC